MHRQLYSNYNRIFYEMHEKTKSYYAYRFGILKKLYTCFNFTEKYFDDVSK